MLKDEIQEFVLTHGVGFATDPSRWYQGGLTLPYDIATESEFPEAGDCRRIWDLLDIDIERDIKDATIFDICCNTGYYAMRSVEEGAVIATGFDGHASAIEAAQRFAAWKDIARVSFVLSDIKDFEWETVYDTVFFLQVLYHLDDPARYLKWALSACRGLMVLIVKDTLPWPEDELRMRLDDCDFQVEDRYPDPLAAGKVIVKGRRHDRK